MPSTRDRTLGLTPEKLRVRIATMIDSGMQRGNYMTGAITRECGAPSTFVMTKDDTKPLCPI